MYSCAQGFRITATAQNTAKGRAAEDETDGQAASGKDGDKDRRRRRQRQRRRRRREARWRDTRAGLVYWACWASPEEQHRREKERQPDPPKPIHRRILPSRLKRRGGESHSASQPASQHQHRRQHHHQHHHRQEPPWLVSEPRLARTQSHTNPPMNNDQPCLDRLSTGRCVWTCSGWLVDAL